MKKMVWFLVVVPLFLYGCGAGGSDSGTWQSGEVSNETPDVISDPVDGSTGRITVNFGSQLEPQRALVTASGWIRNRARLVVRRFAEEPVYETVTEEKCKWNDAGEYNCYQVPVLDADGDPVQQQVGVELKEVYKEIADAGLNPTTGAGVVSIAVPPATDGYALDVLTYCKDVAGAYTYLSSDTGLEVTTEFYSCDAPLDSTSVATGFNFMLQYGKNEDATGATEDASGNRWTFGIDPGLSTSVPVTLSRDLAVLNLPTDPIPSESNYDVSATRTSALRDNWNVRQIQDDTDLSGKWFISDVNGDGEIDASDNTSEVTIRSGIGAITLTTPKRTTPGPWTGSTYKLWHHGQFFISNGLLETEEYANWKDWTYGTSSAGYLNPHGTADVVIIE